MSKICSISTSWTYLWYFEQEFVQVFACLTVKADGTAWIHLGERQLTWKHTVERLQQTVSNRVPTTLQNSFSLTFPDKMN